MNWQAEPATEKQLDYLRMFGYEATRPLTKAEASELISTFEEDPERQEIRDRNSSDATIAEAEKREKNPAFYLRADVEEAKQSDDAEDLDLAKEERLVFWRDTFRNPAEMEEFNEQGAVLYLDYGFRFKVPADEQIQKILDALDASSLTWDKNELSYFFQTLEFNFPDLVLSQPPDVSQ